MLASSEVVGYALSPRDCDVPLSVLICVQRETIEDQANEQIRRARFEHWLKQKQPQSDCATATAAGSATDQPSTSEPSACIP